MRELGPVSAVAFLLCLYCCLYGVMANGATESPRALFPVRSHDFGTAKQGKKLVHEFAVRNQGTIPLTIEGGELSMPGMKARFNRVIAPGAEARITLEWDTNDVKGEVMGEAVLRLNDPDEPTVTLTLSGVVNLAVEVRAFAAVWYPVWKGGSGVRGVTIVNNEEVGVNRHRVRRDG